MERCVTGKLMERGILVHPGDLFVEPGQQEIQPLKFVLWCLRVALEELLIVVPR